MVMAGMVTTLLLTVIMELLTLMETDVSHTPLFLPGVVAMILKPLCQETCALHVEVE